MIILLTGFLYGRGRVDAAVTLPELTLRGIILGALITVVFTASNVYRGLKVGLTVGSKRRRDAQVSACDAVHDR